MNYPIPQNQPENAYCAVQRDRRIAFKLIRELMRTIERLPEEDRGGGLDDAYMTLEKVCRQR